MPAAAIILGVPRAALQKDQADGDEAAAEPGKIESARRERERERQTAGGGRVCVVGRKRE